MVNKIICFLLGHDTIGIVKILSSSWRGETNRYKVVKWCTRCKQEIE